MTLRMDFAWVAIAALGLFVSYVSAARALDFCDVNPDRCRYSPSGKGYYYPRGQPMPQGLEPAFVERNGTTGTAASGQAWGCAASDGKVKSWSARYPNRASAVYGAMAVCAKYGGRCRIVACSSSIHSQADARVLISAARR